MLELVVVSRDGRETTVEGQVGLSVMEALRSSGLGDIKALCGGFCSCATCHVYVDGEGANWLPAIGEDEDALLSDITHRQVHSRLACQLMITKDLEKLRVIIAPED